VVKIRMLIYTPTSRGGSVSNRWSGSLTGRCKQISLVQNFSPLSIVRHKVGA
jgi:hypothetical protein